MALNLGRWLKYAQAKLDSSLSSEHKDMDELEAEQQARVADQPWLASDGETPTFDEAKARIEAEARAQAHAEADVQAADQGRDADGTTGPPTPVAPRSPAQTREDAEVAQARIELDRRERESKERLEAIRQELGVDSPPKDGA